MATSTAYGGVAKTLYHGKNGRGRGFMITRFDLLVVFILLQAADVLTTNAALARPGAREANQLIQAHMHAYGDLWWLQPKLALIGVAIVVARQTRWRWPFALVCLLYVGIVANNLLVAYL